MNLQDEIRKAVGLHGKWKTMLKSAITMGKLDMNLSLIKADDQCNFGRWLHGATITEQQKNSDHYRKVLELHAAFHEIASKVVQLAVSGKTAHAEKMLGVNGEFTTASAALTTAMVGWLKEAN